MVAYNSSDLVLYDQQRDLYALLTTTQAFFGYKEPGVVNFRNIKGYGSWTSTPSRFYFFLQFFVTNLIKFFFLFIKEVPEERVTKMVSTKTKKQIK